MPTPEEYAAERLAARAAEYRAQVARLRALADAPRPTTSTPPTETYLRARRGPETEGATHE